HNRVNASSRATTRQQERLCGPPTGSEDLEHPARHPQISPQRRLPTTLPPGGEARLDLTESTRQTAAPTRAQSVRYGPESVFAFRRNQCSESPECAHSHRRALHRLSSHFVFGVQPPRGTRHYT